MPCSLTMHGTAVVSAKRTKSMIDCSCTVNINTKVSGVALLNGPAYNVALSWHVTMETTKQKSAPEARVMDDNVPS